MNNYSPRILSLDVFRGITMALMVLVNSQGTRFIYPILDHAEWNGCTLADLVFPAFLFIVGVTTVISLKKQRPGHEVYGNILKRSILLFLIGLFLNAFPLHFDLATLRVHGILQRIALCYLVCSIIYLNTAVKTQLLIFVGILLGYWYFITQIPMPGISADQLSIAHNWAGYIDSLILSPAHLYKNFDPEGLLGTIPAIATTLSGLITGNFLLSTYSNPKKCYLMIAVGLLFLLLGWMWGWAFPINKSLWTSSYVLWTSGVSLIVFALCFYLIDVLGYTKWAFPFKVFGMNALFIFIFHVLLLKLQSILLLPLRNGTTDNLKIVISDYLFSGFSQENAGLLYALVFLLFNFIVAFLLYQRKLFIKL